MTTRRGFLGAMLAAAAAPAFVKAEILMPVRQIIVPSTEIIRPGGLVLWGDGVTDDTAAPQAALRGEQVYRPDGSRVVDGGGIDLRGGSYKVSQTIHLFRESTPMRATNVRIDGAAVKDGPVMHIHHGAQYCFDAPLMVTA